MPRHRATLIGFFAVLFWSALALLTVGAAPVPPFQLNAMAFLVGGVIGLGWMAGKGGVAGTLGGIGGPAWALGVGGLFGYHFLYFSALRLAPPAEAGLIAYLWPLLIVLGSGLLPGERLRLLHVLGALISLAGAGLILWGGGAGFDPEFAIGYILAAIGAVTWASYSVLSRRVGHIPTSSVAWFCLAASGLSLLAHLAFETTAWPQGAIGWAAVLGLGIGPVGLAFYLWDIGVKQGDIQLLGVAAYAAPLLSTIILIAFGITAPTQSLLLAAALITAGAALAAHASRKNG